MRLSFVTLLGASLVAVSTVVAQGPGGYGPSGGGGSGPSGGYGGAGRRGGGMGAGRGGMGQSFDLPSSEDIDGPPSPGTFKQLFALTDGQADQYGHGWDSLMAETTPQRDSARSARQTMRAAFQDRDREAAQQQAKLLERLGKDLHKRDEAFDKSLGYLTNDQRKQYDDWKKDQKKTRSSGSS